MKKIKNLLIFLSLALTLGFTQTAMSANDSFQSEQELNGRWLLEYTKLKDQKKDRGEIWIFENSTMVMKNIPQVRGGRYDSSPVAFKIEDGKLKISVLGRPGRFDIYSVIEKTGSSMDLKSNLGEIFHFIKK